jgi:hypothetical protein
VATLLRFGLGTIVRHRDFRRGRLVAYDEERYVIVFPDGDAKAVPFAFEGRGDTASQRPVSAVPEESRYQFVPADAEVSGDVRKDAGKSSDTKCPMPRDGHVVLTTVICRETEVASALAGHAVSEGAKYGSEISPREIAG